MQLTFAFIEKPDLETACLVRELEAGEARIEVLRDEGNGLRNYYVVREGEHPLMTTPRIVRKLPEKFRPDEVLV